MATGNDILNFVLRMYPDYDSASFGATDLQEAMDEVLRRVRLYADTSEQLTLVADQQNYTLNSNDLYIWAATYFESATDSGVPLMATSLDTMDDQFPLWRTAPSSVPQYYWDRGGDVYLWPAPETASSGGFPNVTLYVSRRQTFVGATSLPSLVRDYTAWAYYICWKYSLGYDKGRSDEWRAKFEMGCSDLNRMANGRTARKKSSIGVRIPPVNRK